MNGHINRPRTSMYACDSCGQATNVDSDTNRPATSGPHTVDIASHHRHAHTSEDPFGRDPDYHRCVAEVAFRPDVQRVPLYRWVKSWPDAQRAVKALLFGELVKRAIGLVQFFPSDLYHDALWISEHVHGPTGFYWMARRNGTSICDRAVVQEQISVNEPRSLYWIATFTELVRVRETR